MDRVVSQEEGRRLAVSWKAGFLEASAKQNEVTLKIVYFPTSNINNTFLVPLNYNYQFLYVNVLK